MEQLELFKPVQNITNWRVKSFSADNFAEEEARLDLEKKFIAITEIAAEYNRQSVSHQLSKRESLHRWLKYKEGFSADLVSKLLSEFGTKEGDTILDPFMGSGTTALVCNMLGINSVGFDILPMTSIAIRAKSSVFDYDTEELEKLLDSVKRLIIPDDFEARTPSINITEGAYPDITQRQIEYITRWCKHSEYSTIAKNLLILCVLNSLEKVSYTVKDGQYLRWDNRSPKMVVAAVKREENGRPPLVVRLDKGILPTLKEPLAEELSSVIHDIRSIQRETERPTSSKIEFIEGSALFELPKMEANSINGVITSPPYCNRYDYTRTYALELSYLNTSELQLKELRQELLSCTVENRSKLERLQEYYISLGKEIDFDKTLDIVHSNRALCEVKESLRRRSANGEINNKGVLRMVDGYFTELTFVYAELFRICKSGAKVAFVNDNVRYGGEVISVDFISTEIAEQIGFKPVKVYTLKQQKGNSSQQMKRYGRVALRKSITIWEKP